MSKFDKIENVYVRNIATRTVLTIISIAIIVLFLPRSQGKLFNYEEGQVWRYPALNAQVEFPVFKTDEALQKERDSVVRSYQPYFNMNENMEKEQIDRFREKFQGGIPGLNGNYVNIIAERLHVLYQHGIIDPNVETQMERKGETFLRIVNGKEATAVHRDSVMTTINAYERLFMDPMLGPNRTLLQQCNLNEYIEPNLVYDKDRNETEESDLLSSIAPASGTVMQGERIIDNGSIIDEYKYRVLNSYEKAMAEHNGGDNEVTSTLIGQINYNLLYILYEKNIYSCFGVYDFSRNFLCRFKRRTSRTENSFYAVCTCKLVFAYQ